MLLATVGVDDVYGAVRFDFGTDILRDGINYLPILVGVYALTEVAHALRRSASRASARSSRAR